LEIRAQIEQNENIEKVEVAGKGYLNFYLSNLYFKKSIIDKYNIEWNSYNKLKIEYNETSLEYKNRIKLKIIIEHSSPNLFKPFHIGHMVNNSIGESIHRMFRWRVGNTKAVAFPSDVSPGIAKTIWALKKENKLVEKLTLQEIADAYVIGTKEYKENQKAKKEIDEINSEIYDYLNGKEIKNKNIDFYEKGKELSLEHFKEITKKLGSDFQEIIFESEAEKVGKELVNKNIDDVFQEVQNEDGTKSVIFEGKNFTNVFINSQGFGTYLAKDIGLLKIKKEKYSDFDKSLVVTDVEQKQHFEMVKEAGEKISEISDFVQKSSYLQHGRMTFSGKVKISSRYGNVPLAMEVIQKVQENILEKMQDRDFLEEEKKDISEKLAIATLKYSILKVTSGKNISFDLEKDTNPKGNTGTFLMYSLVRAKSIFRKSNFVKHDDFKKLEYIGDLPILFKKIDRFEEEIQKSKENYSSHFVANYLYDLASEFNSFYGETRILDQENKNYVYNLTMIGVFVEVMEKGLWLLGIESVEKM